MVKLGYALSSEDIAPAMLVKYARAAEEAGFEFALVSDHFHPWTSRQGQSGFVWAVLGAIAARTRKLRVGTGVTCPLLRMHPAIIAQAAATTACLFGSRFFLGLGAGENLNEHVLGDRWPRVTERHARLREAIGIIRGLWSGREFSHTGGFYQVDEARLYSLPESPPEIYVAGTGAESAGIAAELADGFIGVAPDSGLLREFRQGTHWRKPAIGQVALCYARSEQAAQETVVEWWPQSGLKGDLSWELKTPGLIEAACKGLRIEQIVEHISCGPDPKIHARAIGKFIDAGYDQIYLHQIGPDQAAFMDFYARSLRKELA